MKQPENLRTSAVRIRLTRIEHEEISAVAALSGLGICSWVRMVAVRAAGLKASKPPRRKPSEDAKVMARMLGELGKIAGSVNELACANHEGFDVDPVALGEIRAQLKGLREALTKFASEQQG
jgi:hypothetical protein